MEFLNFFPLVQHYRILGRIEKIYEEHLWIYKCKTCFREVENQYDWFFCSQCGEDVETTARNVEDRQRTNDIIMKTSLLKHCVMVQ
ncbi:hypothetical protein RHMOL_Rhmol10G0231500 [Rhododendron molle]|uniref:Uncharacterized protein n=1 Tax=Rhododendron molle TaxID=49168 RepID=A0ACC0M5S1_RHOML|nr:hypothetical protein RHMOL_Rhmol10G0231500 [Rhododendron molle]